MGSGSAYTVYEKVASSSCFADYSSDPAADCSNAGTCDTSGGASLANPTCTCEEVYTGHNCQIPSCSGHGMAADRSMLSAEASKCTCDAESGGVDCECGTSNDDDPTVPGPDWCVRPIATLRMI